MANDGSVQKPKRGPLVGARRGDDLIRIKAKGLIKDFARKDPSMSHTPHALPEEFPDQIDIIQALRTTDAHFARQVDAYHDINRAIHRAETDVEPTDDLHMAQMRKERMVLKDEIAAALRCAV